ncbi:MAG: D-alanyl-D-alanine carboxypeptidase/D-alanyl-D-alanine-endopeptidase [Firmicutes bacterium]|nr:D-alanyl-D-alanine carboxypeptidase/D-alanyl-D-alanine-endopeptidase [Bacillota bacterium]
MRNKAVFTGIMAVLIMLQFVVCGGHPGIFAKEKTQTVAAHILTDDDSPSPGATGSATPAGASPTSVVSASPSGSPAVGMPSNTPVSSPSVFSPVPNGTVSPSPKGTPSASPFVVPTPQLSPAPVLSPEEAKYRRQNRAFLRSQLESFIKNDSVWKNCKVGIYCSVMDTGEEIFSKNGSTPMIPASNMKIVTSATALGLLGPQFQFETSVWGGKVNNGVLQGNLYLRGTGDPTFVEPFTNEPTGVFYKMIQVLKKKGIKEIEGDLVGDDSAFDREFQGRGWKTRYMLEEYAAPGGALSINANLVQINVAGANVKLLPANTAMQIQRTASQGAIAITRILGTDTITIKGNGNGGRTVTVHNPSRFTTSVFAEMLKSEGIKIRGKVRLINNSDADYMSKTFKLCFHKSPNLLKIVRQILKESDNLCAQHVFKAIGYYTKGKGTCDNSLESVREFLKSCGVDPSGLIMVDGSGLSEYNRISPKLFCEILNAMYKHPQGKNFYNALSIAGKDGTLSYRMTDLRVNAKTGTLTGHIGLSGYVVTRGGQIVTFSILTNKNPYSNGAIRGNEDRIVRILANFGDKL